MNITLKGLTANRAEKLLKEYGENKLKAKKAVSWAKVMLDQFKSPLIYILVIASGVTMALGDFIDAGVIGAAVVLNTILGFYQEMKAEKSLEALSKMLSPKAKVIRDGKRELIEASLVVPGDICVLELGERVPADGIVVEANSLSINEAMLTGESVAVEKGGIHPLKLAKNQESKGYSPLAAIGSSEETLKLEAQNQVYMGTMVSGGIGLMEVTKTGQETEIGKIAEKLTETKEEKTPLQKQINKFSKKLAIMVGVISLVILIAGLVAGDPFVEIFTTAVAVAVSAIPEGLAVSLTVILAIGMQRIFKKKALVRKLMAAETLGSVTVICADKTGTLTEGKMKVVDCLTSENQGSEQIFSGSSTNSSPQRSGLKGLPSRTDLNLQETLMVKIAVLCNDMRDPLEIGMMDWAQGLFSGSSTNSSPLRSGLPAQAGLKGVPSRTDLSLEVRNLRTDLSLETLEKEYPRLDQIPFDPKWRYIATLHKPQSRSRSVMRNLLLVSGAPEEILDRCETTEERRKAWGERFVEEGKKGRRLVGFAFKEISKDKINDKDIKGLRWIGSLAYEDPVRIGVE
ncbi:HAD-IC family P-type ATPase, partial [Patescibacteria group bacterium]|nr:HAD-IC family P-type ATPase [Patescibacteria group bacterium]